jgi:hypothetical protein
MFGIWTGSLSARNGRPMPWNRPSRSNSPLAPIASSTSSFGKSSTWMTSPGAEIAKFVRQVAKNLAGQNFEFGKQGRLDPPPGERVGYDLGHERRCRAFSARCPG